MRIALVALVVLFVGCAASTSYEPVRCSRTAEDPAGTCAEDIGPGYICGGDGFLECEPGSEHCECRRPDGRCGAATCEPEDEL